MKRSRTHDGKNPAPGPATPAPGESTETPAPSSSPSTPAAEPEGLSREESLLSGPRIHLVGSWEYSIGSEDFKWVDEVWGNIMEGARNLEKFSDYLQKFVHRDDLAPLQEAFSAAVEEERPYEFEYRIFYPDGTLHHMLSQGNPVRDDQGRMVKFAGTTHDVTELKLTEQIYKDAGEEKFRALVENSIQGILIHHKGKPLFVNQSFADIHGYRTTGELMAFPSIDVLVTAEQVEELRGQESQLLNEETPSLRTEMPALKKDGTEIWVENLSQLMQWEGRRAIQCTVIDITERKLVEEELRKSRENLARAQKIANMGNWEWNLLDDRMEGSEEAHRIVALGKGPYAGSSQDFFSYVVPGDKEKMTSAIVKSIKEGEPFNVHYKINRPDGEVRVLQAYGEILKRDESGRVVTMFGTTHDITDRLHLEEQLRHSQRLKSLGILAGGIAHDFNNILSPILGYSEMMLQKATANSKDLKYLNVIFRSATRAKNLVAQILLFSRRSRSEKIIGDLGSIVEEVVNFMRSTLPTSISTQKNIAKYIAPVYCDPSQMHQLMMNLCVNAGQAMTDSGNLKITLNTVDLDGLKCLFGKILSGKHVRLTVADTGIGMDPETLSNIFDPFFTTKETGEGTGLGLSTVFGIVQDHEGGINVSSEPGRGTTFEIYLPAAGQRIEEPIAQESIVPKGGESILFIDDEVEIAEMGKTMLEGFGYKVTISMDSWKALKMFQDNPNRFDLVVTDQGMPNLEGAQLAAKMRQARHDIPIILCTGHSNTMTPERSKAAGINAFLYKPVKMKDMGEVLRKVLDEARQADTSESKGRAGGEKTSRS